ncbi:L-threonylcarbamoyladenylate synthase [Thermosipho atlanticus]|uniref:Threonylcarbamoyl-AMP synthase n=1 Tax=Thermosipho atlanticus DSM 15807 TaxID=1123380 RepID=A0A1M5RW77_9BACT|nr:L-threonylcarbamoyladenylate synthase [Thermosipho atlanticus]SHH30421.1 translation factor SUA5 [Thermosipho atlanticus DSM 15807]
METIILKIDPLGEIDIKIPVEIIKKGGLVAFPTETVYGLGASVFNAHAVSNIYKVKGRASDNPLIVHVSDFNSVSDIAILPEKFEKVVKKLTPGPITFVLKKKEGIPDVVTAGLNTVGVRIPAHPVARKLCELAGPIAAPSANLSGKPSPTNASAVIEDLNGKIDCIIDSGDTPFGLESTIIDLSGCTPVVLRPGPITIEELREIFGEIDIPDFVKNANHVENPKAPGMKYKHYAPEKPLYMFYRHEREKILKLVEKENGVIICPEEHRKLYPKERVIILGKLENPYSIAQNLFKVLRLFDKTGFQVGFIEAFEESGILFSVMNRLKKAAKLWR